MHPRRRQPALARAVIRVFDPELDESVIDKRTEVRMKRQERLLTGDVSLWAVVDAGAILRVVGGANVHGEQVPHLLTVAQHPSVTFQVLPPEAGEHIAQGTPFACFTFPDGGGAVAIDHLAGTWCTEDQPIVDRYTLAGEHLRATALSARDSLAWVRKVADSLG